MRRQCPRGSRRGGLETIALDLVFRISPANKGQCEQTAEGVSKQFRSLPCFVRRTGGIRPGAELASSFLSPYRRLCTLDPRTEETLVKAWDRGIETLKEFPLATTRCVALVLIKPRGDSTKSRADGVKDPSVPRPAARARVTQD